ncbi:MAG: hypothetical protein WCZ23_01530 [Rhodospirillaceae bacterium]
MARALPAVALGVLMVTAGSAGAQELGDRYAVTGVTADGSTSYTGTVRVSPFGDTYGVVWQFPDSQEIYLGTGILRGSTFAVVYQSPRVPGPPGLVLYDIAKDGGLTGYFSALGANAVGAETWTPAKE